MTMKDIAKGWEPRKPQDDFASWSKIIAASLTQGGGAGILGDFLFGEANRFGGGAAATAMGPGLGAAFDLFDIWRRAKEGDFRAASSSAGCRATLPFVNLFYLRPATNFTCCP